MDEKKSRLLEPGEQTVEFPVGYHQFHSNKIMNYQLNRWYSFGYWRLEDLQEAALRINTLEDWKHEMVRQAEKAVADGRMVNAAFFYRSAEFFTLPDDPDKLTLYDVFQETFYGHVFDPSRAERVQVPYEGVFLPAFWLKAQPEEAKGTLVIHGGFDSFTEEFYYMALWFSDHGYDVILFDGPGQGGARKLHDLPLTHEWEKPAKAVLDYFDVHDVTWLGFSLGGWLCFRAAAFEPRIARVIASSIIFLLPAWLYRLVSVFMRFPRAFIALARLNARLSQQERWAMHQMLYVFKADTIIDGVNKFFEFTVENQRPESVAQDVLILTGREDHFVPFGMQLKMHDRQVDVLNNARSVTGRIFTKEEHAQNHCQVGNMGLALREMEDWITK
jgi:pimeloyl-ACP methyl ester carboxylesterase